MKFILRYNEASSLWITITLDLWFICRRVHYHPGWTLGQHWHLRPSSTTTTRGFLTDKCCFSLNCLKNVGQSSSAWLKSPYITAVFFLSLSHFDLTSHWWKSTAETWNSWGRMTFFPLAATGEREWVRFTVQMGDSNEYKARWIVAWCLRAIWSWSPLDMMQDSRARRRTHLWEAVKLMVEMALACSGTQTTTESENCPRVRLWRADSHSHYSARRLLRVGMETTAHLMNLERNNFCKQNYSLIAWQPHVLAGKSTDLGAH